MIKFFVSYAAFQNIPYQHFFKLAFQFLLHLKFECMLVGALGAYLVYCKSRVIKKISKTVFLGSAFFLLMFFQFFPISSITNWILLDPIFATVFTPFIHSLLVIIIIANATQKNKVNAFLEHPIIYFLGKISYGLYVFHPILLMLLYALPTHSISHNWLVQYIGIIGRTILVSSLSYNYFEKWFLKRKNNFSIIISGDNVK